MQRQEFPNATRATGGRLRAGAAVGVGEDLEERVSALVAAGVDAVVVDTAHGHSAGVMNAVQRIKSAWPDLAVVAGNVVTEEGVDALHSAGVDAVKVGVGAGSICTTRVVAGAGMPQLSAIWHTAQRANQLGIPLIADAGVTHSVTLVKSFASGLTVVTFGSVVGWSEETVGDA